MGKVFTMDDLRYQIDLLTAINQKLNNENRMLNIICETSHRAFVYINYIQNTLRTVGKWNSFFDIRINETAELPRILECFNETDETELRRLIYVEKTGSTQQAIECLSRDGKSWYLIEATIYYNESGVLSEKIISFTDITKQRLRKEELSYLAYYDNLTGLYNRNFFVAKLNEFIEKAKEENNIVSVMLFDIDDFHKVNDSRGLIAGDDIVQSIGFFFKELLDDNIITSHFDGDIFCVAIYEPIGKRSVDSIYRKVSEFLSSPIKLTDGSEVNISVSVGVAEFPESADNSLALINYAEIVMLKAKTSGKNHIQFFDSSLLNSFLKDVEIENKLKEAVYDKKFYLNFQPQFYTDTKKLRGVEALIRWKDNEGNYYRPDLFIPIAEKNGSIITIGDFVIEESIKAHMEWKKKFGYDMTISINISSIQYSRADFVPKLLSTINKYEMNPEELELEITESVLIEDLTSIIAKMNELKDYGIKVSLDDFGTGFSSLSYIRGLPINTLKLDKSFIDNIENDKSSRIIVDTIISMAKKLGFITVAEGVETNGQYEILKAFECDLIQGYYWGKPVSYEEIEEILFRLI